MANIHPMMLPLLARWETAQLKTYKDTDGSLRIGYGHGNINTVAPIVTEDMVLKDEAEAMEILLRELNEIYVPQLNSLFKKIDFTPPNDLYFSGWLDCLYNRGYGTVSKSAAYDWLKKPDRKNYMVHAANAFVLSHVEGFEPLDVSWDKNLGKVRVYEGLTARRACDTALCLWERF